MGCTLWLCQQFAIEAMAIEIVDLPIKQGDLNHSSVSLPEGNNTNLPMLIVKYKDK